MDRSGPAVNAKVLKGKKIVTFPISDEIDACNTKGQQGYFAAEAKKLGADVVNLTANAGPTDWNSDLAQAISQKAKAVVMFCGPTAAAISTELTAVKNAHIPVVNGNYNRPAARRRSRSPTSRVRPAPTRRAASPTTSSRR